MNWGKDEKERREGGKEEKEYVRKNGQLKGKRKTETWKGKEKEEKTENKNSVI